jgi:hypothetical protein
MSASESERSEESPPFVEDDARETRLPYDKGGLPVLVAIGWLVFAVVHIAFMYLYGLPDLRRWLAH